jgi:hypothetical protein
MSIIGSVLGDLGVGNNPIYSWTQQDKDFIKAQFKYGLKLKQKLDSGAITQDYYNNNVWLTTQSLQAPYNGWWSEFQQAINSEDLNWLAKQVGETVDQLTVYMGDALTFVAQKAGAVVGTAISSTTGGIFGGFFGSLTIVGWLAVIGIGAATYYGFKTGLIQRALKTGIKSAVIAV